MVVCDVRPCGAVQVISFPLKAAEGQQLAQETCPGMRSQARAPASSNPVWGSVGVSQEPTCGSQGPASVSSCPRVHPLSPRLPFLLSPRSYTSLCPGSWVAPKTDQAVAGVEGCTELGSMPLEGSQSLGPVPATQARPVETSLGLWVPWGPQIRYFSVLCGKWKASEAAHANICKIDANNGYFPLKTVWTLDIVF